VGVTWKDSLLQTISLFRILTAGFDVTVYRSADRCSASRARFANCFLSALLMTILLIGRIQNESQ
jgi:hypothetical protein